MISTKNSNTNFYPEIKLKYSIDCLKIFFSSDKIGWIQTKKNSFDKENNNNKAVHKK